MANQEHLAILMQGVEVWNKWRKENPKVEPDLSRASLCGANLCEWDFAESIVEETPNGLLFTKPRLDYAKLHGAVLLHADFEGASLVGADLRDARLRGTSFQRTDLTLAKLGRTDLLAINFTGTRLRQTDFSKSLFGSNLLVGVNLESVKGLETVNYIGTSVVSIDTIVLSQGNISDSFLRGCGVPETFIIYARSLVGKPFDFYSCFISHSSKDKRFCERLYADLQANAVRVWYFPEDAKWGEPIWGEIDHSIKIYDKLIIVCSKHSLTSGPVLREIERALNREDKEGKNVLFPITIDRFIFDEWEHPRKDDVLQKVVGTDFVGWNRDATKYDKAFKKLLKALKAQ